MDTYTTAAQQGFEYLADDLFNGDTFANNFWFAGNTFHALIDYLLIANINDEKTKQILVTGHEIYDSMYQSPSWWHDDFGWWGDSFVKAINGRSKLGYGDPKYNPFFETLFNAADYCWSQMTPWSADKYGVPADHAAGSADIPGGVYNIVDNPDNNKMQGRNSVTNEGYWLLSYGLAELRPNNGGYQTAARNAKSWFGAWLARTPKCNDPKSQIGILNQQCLVLERPMGNIQQAEWYWSGDQGLLSRAVAVAGGHAGKATEIVNAAIANMKDDRNVLHENMSFMDVQNLQQYLGDYATGKGIFMRSLRYVNPGPIGPFSQFIRDNATAVWCHKKGRQFPFNWDLNLKKGYEPAELTGPDGVPTPLQRAIMQAAGLDALNAAMLIDPMGPITCKP